MAARTRRLGELVAAAEAVDRLGRGLPSAEAATALDLPPVLLGPLAADAGLVLRDGRLLSPAAAGPRVPGGARRPARFVDRPAAPDAVRRPRRPPTWRRAPDPEGSRRAGRARGDPPAARRRRAAADRPRTGSEALRSIEQPFTLSEARRALGTTRRVAVPLLEHLDRLRLTVRDPDSRRRLSERAQAGNTAAARDTGQV